MSMAWGWQWKDIDLKLQFNLNSEALNNSSIINTLRRFLRGRNYYTVVIVHQNNMKEERWKSKIIYCST